MPGRHELDEEVEVIMGMNILNERFRRAPFTLSDATRSLGEGDEFSMLVLDRLMDLGIAHEAEGLYRMEER